MLRRVALSYKHKLTFLYADGQKNLLQAQKVLLLVVWFFFSTIIRASLVFRVVCGPP